MKRRSRRDGILGHSVADCGGNLVMGCVGSADIQDGSGVMGRHADEVVDGLNDVLLKKITLA